MSGVQVGVPKNGPHDSTIFGYRLENPKPSKAVRDAQKKYDKVKQQYDKAVSNSKKKQNLVDKLAKQRSKAKSPTERSRIQRKINQAVKARDGYDKRSNILKNAKNAAKKKLDRVKKDDNRAYTLKQVTNKVSEHAKSFRNEGTAAIYQSSGDDDTVIYIAPTENESDDTASNITSWPVDQGSPRSDHARISSKTITVSGLIKGETMSDSLAKFDTLRTWNSRHYELTYKGNIYYKHLIISDLQRSYKSYETDIACSITFQFVYAAEITTSSKKTKKKSSKSSKTVSGNRNKNYTAITVKGGDTLWGLSQKYGKPVSWLQKVNKIKNANLIYVGQKLRVR
ncbi:nucleoid-associated protein YgaU [Lactobacillus colini]|uniref:Nucleoid-associated protein YgaU n=1 Tax=Lactobacillus colini TaxID=1819254 RepID=A0ABS4MDY5_9LACO|nr:LysM domain-containing protein [Lactobacillus colini]MBP2057900.1 nucleoid-associated protein YgaU [Lactobacillus colini]